MLIFLVVHMLGNLSAFAGADAFNTYGHMLNQNPALKFIEYYLLLVAVLHVLVGTYLTFKKNKFTINKGFFIFTGFLLLGFIVTHLMTFKFGTDYRTKEGVRDLFKLEQEVFSDPKQVAWYVVPLSLRPAARSLCGHSPAPLLLLPLPPSVPLAARALVAGRRYVLSCGVLSWHLWRGWEAAVWRMDLLKENKETREAGKAIGHFLIVPLTVGFISTPIWFLMTNGGSA